MESDEEYKIRNEKFKNDVWDKMLFELQFEGFIEKSDDGIIKLTEKFAIERAKILYFTTQDVNIKRK